MKRLNLSWFERIIYSCLTSIELGHCLLPALIWAKPLAFPSSWVCHTWDWNYAISSPESPVCWLNCRTWDLSSSITVWANSIYIYRKHRLIHHWYQSVSRRTEFWWVFWIGKDCISSSEENIDSPWHDLAKEYIKYFHWILVISHLWDARNWLSMYNAFEHFITLMTIMRLAGCFYCFWTKWEKKRMNSNIWIPTSRATKMTWKILWEPWREMPI